VLAALAATCLLGLGCSVFSSKPHEPKAAPTAQLVEANPDIAARDLFHGVGGRSRVPDAKVEYRFLERDDSGVSTNFDIEDPQGRKWDAKFGKEVKSEIASSRLLWAIGFHQPPVYYMREWRIANGPEAGVQPEARFRLEKPYWEKHGDWDWQDNPFVGTRELRGLVVMMAMLNSWDLKTSNNAIYERNGDRLFVVKDLGDAFGKSARIFLGTLNNVRDFENEKFIRRVKNGHVDLYYRPVMLNWGVDNDLTVEDVLWTCRRLDRLSDRQWRDAFRAAGYSDAEGTAYSTRLKAKVREGLALAEGARA
jgi:hypothetical protein